MKKLFALLLALALTLVGTLGLAEGVTITSELEIDREAARTIMAGMNMKPGEIEQADAALALLTAAKEVLVIADDGFQYDLSLNDTEVFTLAGQGGDADFAIISTLFPNYALTISANTIMEALANIASQASSGAVDMSGVDVQKLEAVVTGYWNEFIDEVRAAVTAGEPEIVEYTMEDGTSFNARIPMNVDEAAVVAAANRMLQKLAADETVLSALKSLSGEGEITVEEIPADNLPEVQLSVYMNYSGEGVSYDTMYVAMDILSAGAESAAIKLDVFRNGDSTQVALSVPDEEITGVYNYTASDIGIIAALELYVKEVYSAFAFTAGEEDGKTVVASYIYYMDKYNPLISEVTTVAPGGALTVDVRGAGKTALPVEKLFSGDDASAATDLALDILLNGLGNLLTKATEAVPETAVLTSALTDMM